MKWRNSDSEISTRWKEFDGNKGSASFPTASQQIDIKLVESYARFLLSLSQSLFLENGAALIYAYFVTLERRLLDLCYICLSMWPSDNQNKMFLKLVEYFYIDILYWNFCQY